MNVEEIVHFLELLDVRGIQIDYDRGWVRAQCPFAPWKHSRGTDSNPSFGVKETEEGSPVYKCLSCDSVGSLPLMIHSLQWLRGEKLGAATNYLLKFPEVFGEGDIDMAQAVERKRIKHNAYFDDAVKKMAINRPVPQQTLDTIPLLLDATGKQADEAYDYLVNERHITERVIKEYGIRLFLDNFKLPVIVFPMVSRKTGEIVDLWGRWVGSKNFMRLTASITGSPYEYKAPHLWFGWQFYDTKKPTMLVEGAIDLLRLRSLGLYGYNIWSGMGSLSKEQIGQIWTDQELILGFDSDSAGEKMAKEILEGTSVSTVSAIRWHMVDPQHPFKDAGDLKTVAQLKKALTYPVKTYLRHGDVLR